MPMKNDSIAIVFSALHVGGAEKIGINLANKFAAEGQRTHIILFQQVNNHLLHTVDKRIEIIYIDRKSKYDISLSKPFDQAIQDRHIKKVIFFCLTPLFLSRVFSFKRQKKVSYYITLHSTIPINFKAYLKTLLLLQFARTSDKVLFVCRNQMLYKQKRFRFFPSKSEIIHNGVDIDYFRPGNCLNTTDRKKSMLIPGDHKIVLLVATIRPEKGHALAIEALHFLHTKFPGSCNTHLIIVGEGQSAYVNELKRLVVKLSLQEYVRFEGNQHDVRPYYEIADIFTLTSISVETFSIAALEAMSYGLPISLSNIGGASEMIFNNQNGKLSIPNDAMSIADSWHQLLQGQYDKKSIRELAVKNFSFDGVYQKYAAAIN
jgi:glycosyltransferase involved in cell wall biosynthesis